MTAQLFTPLKLRELTLKNRIVVSPMCEYSAIDGVPNDWHLVHLGSRAVGGAALVIAEATGVSPEGRISPGDTGLWNDEQMRAWARITKFIREQGSLAGIQLAHAGRKASDSIPWEGEEALSPAKGGWTPLAPSAIPFDPSSPMPKKMSLEDCLLVREQFEASTRRALEAGFQVVEIHMAHGYLLNEFLSPLTNGRKDQYGGSRENRMRFPLEVADTVRKIWPQEWPVFVRISATDWVDGGWNLEDSIAFARELKKIGIDLVDCSTGGTVPDAKIPAGPGYQVPFAEGVRKGADIATGAVGIITHAEQAEEIIQSGKADVVLLARELLRDPYWPLHAAKKLGADVAWPKQYARAKR
jgi:2,4-dienoyl-CoA reductase-like NADH-dependent reductase (Old Yellow Enzyme family)